VFKIVKEKLSVHCVIERGEMSLKLTLKQNTTPSMSQKKWMENNECQNLSYNICWV